MKKAIVALALSALASSAFAGVSGSPHDLSAATGPGTYPNGLLSSCQFCHAPHNVNTSVPGTPLWNRTTPAGDDGLGHFTIYASNTLRGTITQPGANSQTCLSCHDGATDMGATFTGGAGFAAPTQMTVATSGTKVIGTVLTDDHPISVRYGGASAQLKDVASVVSVKLYGTVGNETVECGSCHDPHSFGGAVPPKFLRDARATICTQCHIK
jgi:predicted CXXCH cytochrome family protein